ncbi:formate dehydrogenase accessory protein FdhE [Pigmentiphaga soli]|uniref:Protein FdhE homolog n=1 Tax=Pigmentiphaga soli TaxID=1007095 RepID=A0ABP8GF31_9BURK
MQRILQPGEIEALDHNAIPRLRLPEPATLFAERAARLRQLADGNPVGDYLLLMATLADAQQRAAAAVAAAGSSADAQAAAAERAAAGTTTSADQARRHGMPVLPATGPLPPAWRDALAILLDGVSQGAALPPEVAAAIADLRAAAPAQLDARAQGLLAGNDAAAPAEAPFIQAALQVAFCAAASRLSPADVADDTPATLCPVCGSHPVASVIRIGGQSQGYRYLHCPLCATEWHMVRVKCSHCESTAGIAYRGIEGGPEYAQAETCDACGSYRKIFNMEKDHQVEPLADDLGTLVLDLLMAETEFARRSGNPLLALPGGTEEA